jgi:hypothetical protein
MYGGIFLLINSLSPISHDMSGKFGMGAISVEVTPVEVTSVEENSRE